MWFRNLKIYRLSPTWGLSVSQLELALEKYQFKPGNTTEMQSLGFVPPRENGGLVYTVDNSGQLMIAMRAERKLLPSSVISQFAKARAQEAEEKQGYKPGRKQMKEIKEQVTDELLPKAFSIYRDTRVWIDTKHRWLVIDTSTGAKSDEVLGLLAKTIDPFPVESLYVTQSPAAAMTGWLAEDEAPANFTIDQNTELRATGESLAKVKYIHHTIDPDDVRRHIQSGKQCTRLALTWADRVSLVLTEDLDVRGVSPLDVIKENNEALSQNDDEQFASDFTLMAGELAKMLDDLVDALGGEKEL